jgi:hypothetical protein
MRTVRTSQAVPAPLRDASTYVFLNRQVNRDIEGPTNASGFRRVNNCLIAGGYLMSSRTDHTTVSLKISIYSTQYYITMQRAPGSINEEKVRSKTTSKPAPNG